jgi:hypothetical protein
MTVRFKRPQTLTYPHYQVEYSDVREIKFYPDNYKENLVGCMGLIFGSLQKIETSSETHELSSSLVIYDSGRPNPRYISIPPRED